MFTVVFIFSDQRLAFPVCLNIKHNISTATDIKVSALGSRVGWTRAHKERTNAMAGFNLVNEQNIF